MFDAIYGPPVTDDVTRRDATHGTITLRVLHLKQELIDWVVIDIAAEAEVAAGCSLECSDPHRGVIVMYNK